MKLVPSPYVSYLVTPLLHAAVKNPKLHVLQSLASLGVPKSAVTFRTVFASKIASIASFSLSDKYDAKTLAESIPLNTKAHQVSARYLHAPMKQSHFSSPVGTPHASHGSSFPSSEAIHNLTGVNLVRTKLKLYGKGVKVALIDTGVYYLHPALGGGFGPGYKIAFGCKSCPLFFVVLQKSSLIIIF